MKRGSLTAHLRQLSGQSAIYGSADVASQIINLLLTPVYVKFLTLPELGVLELLLLFSAFGKIVFRMGLDAGFFRVYYDLDSADERRELAGTVALYSAAAGVALWCLTALGAPVLARLLFGASGPDLRRFVLLAATDLFLGTFLFIPLILLRIRNQVGRFAAFNAGRNLVNTGLKVALVVSGHGVAGVLWSDITATALLALALAPILVRETRLAFSGQRLREVLAFCLPKAPHGIMVQVLSLADRWILRQYSSLALIGVYGKAYALGAGVKFVLSAFEPAWQPFVYAQIGTPDAPRTFARLATYVWAVFLVVGLGVAVFGRELLMAFTFTNPSIWIGAPVVPVVALGCLGHGAFLLSSIGIAISKKTRYYPIVTAVAAAVNVGGNFLLIPRWGMMGAAWATVASYLAMAAAGYVISHRVYPIPFEKGRLARLTAAALLAFFVSLVAPVPQVAAPGSGGRSVHYFITQVVPGLVPAVGVKLLLLGVFPALVVLLGVVRSEEWAWLRRRLGRYLASKDALSRTTSSTKR